jgi:polysaccharide deacetylase family protein (PEP-CTERM system associated)
MVPAHSIQDQTTARLPLGQEEVPFISIVVPVRNEERHLGSTLAQLLNQDYDPACYEILVADGRSTDGTCDIVRDLQAAHTNLYLLDNPKKLASAGRNRAIEAARGDFIVIVDGHCELPGEHYLRDLATAFARSEAASLGRPQPLDVTRATPLQRAIALARSSWLGHNPSSLIYSTREEFVRPQSVAVAYRREVFATVGLFDESFDACEDVEFNHRIAKAGFSCYFAPQTRVLYHPRRGLVRLFRQMVRYGRGRVRLIRKHRETLSLPCLAPAAWLGGTVVFGMFAALIPWLRWPLAAALGFYLFVLAAVSIRLASQAKSTALLWRLPAVFAAIHLGAGAGELWEVLAGWRRQGQRKATPIASPHPSIWAEPTVAANTTTSRCERQTILNALTFDVEDYYQVANFDGLIPRWQWDALESRVEASTHKILTALDQVGTQATFFVLGWVADRHPQLVRTIQAAGHEIGCHGYWHRLIYRQTPAQFREDVRRAQGILQAITGEPVTAYRAPCFSITERSLWALDVLIEEGFRLDSSIYPTRHDRYGIAGARPEPHCIRRSAGTLWEFPLPTRRTLGFPLPVGGGGYFRLYPYWFTARALRAINAAGQPFVTYLHPWEFDPDQPRFAPSRLQAFRHYVNLEQTAPRLTALLNDFHFGTLSQALKECTATQQAAPARARAA